jgi:hypothetical protein
MIFLVRPCWSGGMADAADSKSVARKGVWVRLPHASAKSFLYAVLTEGVDSNSKSDSN